MVTIDGSRVAFADLVARMDPYLRRTLEQAVMGVITVQEFAEVYALAHLQEFGRSVLAD